MPTNQTNSGPANRGGVRPRPNYEAYKVDAIPEDVTMPRTGPRVDPKFTKGIADAMADPGGIYVVGEYESDNGAGNMHKRIESGEVKLPYGDWVIEHRRVWQEDEDGNIVHGEDGKPKRRSLLYAVYEGPVPAES